MKMGKACDVTQIGLSLTRGKVFTCSCLPAFRSEPNSAIPAYLFKSGWMAQSPLVEELSHTAWLYRSVIHR